MVPGLAWCRHVRGVLVVPSVCGAVKVQVSLTGALPKSRIGLISKKKVLNALEINRDKGCTLVVSLRVK